MRFRRYAVTSAVAAALLALGAASASAGEVSGNGKELPLRGASICKFSGLNDEITPEEPTRTQSYGTFLVLYGKEFLPSPGLACNPTTGFEE